MGFMDSFLRKKTSGSTAKDRLKLVLVSDRANCSPETMELIKNDIIKVISKYRRTGYSDNPDRVGWRTWKCSGNLCQYTD